MFIKGMVLIWFYCSLVFSQGLSQNNYALQISSNNFVDKMTSRMLPDDNSSHDIELKLKSAKSLAITGTLLWIGGEVLSVIGASMLINSSGEKGSGLLITGLVMGVLGPLPSVVGENQAKRIVGQTNPYGLGRRFGMSADKAYGLSWTFVVLALGAQSMPGEVATFSPLLGLASDIFRGFAAISPIPRINRTLDSFRPALHFNPENNSFGLTLNFKLGYY